MSEIYSYVLQFRFSFGWMILILLQPCFFFPYFCAGTGAHFVSKVLYRYLKKDKDSEIYRVNEKFRGKLSHYFVFGGIVFIVFFIALLEINHPLSSPINQTYFIVISLFAIIAGIWGMKIISSFLNDYFGGYNKPIFIIVFILLCSLLYFFKTFKLIIFYYPVSLFIIFFYISFVISLPCWIGIKRYLLLPRFN